MEPRILYEDDSLFVLDKPSGWITNSSSTTTDQPVVQKWLEKNFQYPLSGDELMRSGIVHRLDKETSGILITAKTKEAFMALQAAFKAREVQKTYITLLHGHVKRDESSVQRGVDGVISVPVGRLPWRRDRFGVVSGGRESHSVYKVLRSIKGERGGYSLVEFYPKTGRTHQIRIHARHIGHAIVADEFYAGRKTARNDRKWCPRLFLHASGIKFKHPESGKEVNFESPLPPDLADILKVL
jgi:23S rRNA pseudouridine1911/1915/1917 synthase